jgi:hypothetical protein
MKRQRLLWLTHAVLTSTTAVLLLSGPAMAGVAQAQAEQPAPKPSASTESKQTVPAEQVPVDQVPPADRDKVLPKGWRGSADRVWTTSGDANGFHVLTATASTGYTWETAASLSEPGFDVDSGSATPASPDPAGGWSWCTRRGRSPTRPTYSTGVASPPWST